MSNAVEPWRATVVGMLGHPLSSALFVQRREGGYLLPSLQLDVEWHPIRETCRGMHDLLGVPVNVLHCARYVSDDEARHNQFTYGLEIAGDTSPDRLTCPGRWVGLADLTDLTWLQPGHEALVRAALQEAESGVPAQRAPWAQPGWHAEAAAWIDAALAAAGQPRRGEIEPLRVWALSCVLKAPTEAGDYYFKAVAHMPLFVNEPVLVRRLGELRPGRVPMPLAVEPQRRWMLLPDWGLPLDEVGPELRIHLLEEFALLQQAAIPEVNSLLDSGCLDRRLAVLAEQIDPLLGDPLATRDLRDDERSRLQEAAPGLGQRCIELAGGEVPQTLVHGDLHVGNIALVDGQPLFYDWTDACIAHPFFDAVENTKEEPEPLRSQLRAAYLMTWSSYAPAERLERIWRLAEPLAYVHLAVSYRFIVATMELAEQPMLAGAIPYYLRLALAALAAPGQAERPAVYPGGEL